MRWFQKTWAAFLFLILFAPVGIFLVWKYHGNWNKNVKIACTAVFGAFFLGVLLNALTTPKEEINTDVPDVALESVSPAPSVVPSFEVSPTLEPVVTPTAEASALPESAPSAEPIATPEPSPTATPLSSSSPTAEPLPPVTQEHTPTPEPTQTPSMEPTPTAEKKFIVYWGNTGDKVHMKPDCSTIKNGVLSGTIEECRDAGHTEGWCGVCSIGWSDERLLSDGNPYAN